MLMLFISNDHEPKETIVAQINAAPFADNQRLQLTGFNWLFDTVRMAFMAGVLIEW